MTRPFATGLPGGHSEWEPPDPFSNSEVKTLCADASVDFVDVKVGHCQALKFDAFFDQTKKGNPRRRKPSGVFSFLTFVPLGGIKEPRDTGYWAPDADERRI